VRKDKRTLFLCLCETHLSSICTLLNRLEKLPMDYPSSGYSTIVDIRKKVIDVRVQLRVLKGNLFE